MRTGRNGRNILGGSNETHPIRHAPPRLGGLSAHGAQAQDLVFEPGEGGFNWDSYEEFADTHDLSGQSITVSGPWIGSDRDLGELGLRLFHRSHRRHRELLRPPTASNRNCVAPPRPAACPMSPWIPAAWPAGRSGPPGRGRAADRGRRGVDRRKLRGRRKLGRPGHLREHGRRVARR